MLKTKVVKQYIDGQYGQLHLRKAGQASSKAAIICLHMAPKSGRGFHELLPYLACDRLVLAPDYPGHGESDHPPAEPHVSVVDYAHSIVQVIEHFSLKDVHLVGLHTGSMVAVELAKQVPELISKIINISTPIITDEELEVLNKYFLPIPLDTQGTRFRILWERIIQHRGPDMTLKMCADSMAENLRGGDDYEWGHRAAFAYVKEYLDNIKNLKQELFVMNPKDDLYEHTKRVDEYLQNGFRKDYLDFANGFLNASPEQAAEIMLDFFDK